MDLAMMCIAFSIASALLMSKNLRTWLWPRFVAFHRVATLLSYIFPFILQATIYCRPTKENARWFRRLVLSMWVPSACAFYTAALGNHLATSVAGKILLHFLWLYTVDLPMGICVFSSSILLQIFGRESEHRLLGRQPRFHGKRVVVLGNGPSLVKGQPLGKHIDGMDEVVRFNNFQTKTSGLEQWTGSKTTMHFSDSMLYPSYPEYHCPGASVGLSLFMDRLMVAGSYLIFRAGVDLAVKEALDMMLDPALGFIPHDDICSLKQTLGISHWKHPTSGCLAIDWFVRHRPDPSVPVYIHGFDFFEGPEIHYYNKTEPLYERINDLIGVTTMHQPEKEKAFVAQLVKEGKVQWLKDFAEGSKSAEESKSEDSYSKGGA